MNLIDLNEIYKIIYYKYTLSFKVLDIIGVKHSQSVLKTEGLGYYVVLKVQNIFIFYILKQMRLRRPLMQVNRLSHTLKKLRKILK